MSLENLYQRKNAISRVLTAENFLGEKGSACMATPETTLHPDSAYAARELGVKWKMSPCIVLDAGATIKLMDHDGPGVIRHMWFTMRSGEFFRNIILRIYWDGEETPSVECPIGDFFCNSWNTQQLIYAQPINCNPYGGFNCFFPMPFRSHACITVTNESTKPEPAFFYTIDYSLEEVAEDALYFHAQWRRQNPVPLGKNYIVLDGVKGYGHYVGMFLAYQQNNGGWFGEGEIHMYIDGDTEYPTIAYTGTEDYFGGAWGFGKNHLSESFSAPYFGYQLVPPPGLTDTPALHRIPGARFTLYRFCVNDPVFFSKDLRIELQLLGWRSDQRLLQLQDDVASVVYWYQGEPHGAFPVLPSKNEREIV